MSARPQTGAAGVAAGPARPFGWVVLGALLLAGCRRGPPPSATPDAAPRVSVAAPSAPAALALTLHGERADAGSWELPLQPGDPMTIPGADTLTLRANLTLKNHRIRLFDEADRVLESDDQDTGAPDGGLSYRIQLHDPLLAGHRYALVIDPATPGVVRDSTGRDLDELRWDLRVEGDREKAPARASRRNRRHH